jgi:hypothetical protein
MAHQRQPKWLIAVFAGLFLCGLFMAASSRRTERLAKSLPRMSCDDLLRMGRAAPRYVTLTDVHVCENGYAFYRDMDAAMSMYVPIFSTTLANAPRGANLVLLLEVLDDRERERLLERPAIGELPVELWTNAAALDPWVQDTLGPMYPGIRVANCRVVSVGLHEPSEFRARYEWREGIVMMLVAAACQLGWWSWQWFSRSREPESKVNQSIDEPCHAQPDSN